VSGFPSFSFGKLLEPSVQGLELFRQIVAGRVVDEGCASPRDSRIFTDEEMRSIVA
jgi:hypothetical protein